MRVNKKEARLLEKAIDQWQQEELLDTDKAAELKQSVTSYRDEFDSLAFYASIAAVSCALLAFGALVLDEKWIERLRNFFEFSEMVIGIIFAGIAVLLMVIAKRRKNKFTYATLANESFTVLIALAIGISVAYFARSLHTTYPYYGAAFLAAAIAYGLVAFFLKSKLLWVCMLLALITGWATQTYAWSSDEAGSYFWGMNYPLRMVLLGAGLIITSFLLRNQGAFRYFYRLTWYGSWVFFLLSALFLSASGNLSYDVWAAIRQGKLMVWAIGYTVLLALILFFSVRQKDESLRDIAIVFFLLNIYTRYFEYFWDRTNKGLFFALLALSFWLIGKKAEQLRKKIS